MPLVFRSNVGFTLVEVLVAVVIVGVGIGALAGSSALVTRMIGRGRVESRAAQLAASRMEQLRLAAGSTAPRCSSVAFADGGPFSTQQVTERWEVDPTGAARQMRVIVSYPVPGGTHADTLQTRIDC
jgi:prepilin-type N-terminal cleavage/methylation domain-containing protein